MLAPDDPRHGEPKGYAAGCRELCCRRAAMRYNKIRLIHKARNGRGLSVDATGTRRRVEALQAIGWSADHIAREGGWGHRNHVNRIRTLKWVERKTYETIRDVYERLSMTPGPSDLTRRRAAARGYAPPLAWDDIDRDPMPNDYYLNIVSKDVDEVAVDRFLRGDHKIALNRAERAEVLRRWTAAGRSLRQLEHLAGWNVHRMIREDAA